jgi:hypothetical protein
MRTGDDSKMLIYSRCQRIHGWHVVALSESQVLNGADRHQPAVPEQSVCASQKHHKIFYKRPCLMGKSFKIGHMGFEEVTRSTGCQVS